MFDNLPTLDWNELDGRWLLIQIVQLDDGKVMVGKAGNGTTYIFGDIPEEAK